MISLQDIQRCYKDLYIAMRSYIWDFNVVQHLAELEEALYSRFPNIDNARCKLNILNNDIRRVCKEDEDLSKSISELKDLLNSSDGIFSRLLNSCAV